MHPDTAVDPSLDWLQLKVANLRTGKDSWASVAAVVEAVEYWKDSGPRGRRTCSMRIQLPPVYRTHFVWPHLLHQPSRKMRFALRQSSNNSWQRCFALVQVETCSDTAARTVAD